MKLCDKRTPTCPHCGMAKLEADDIIDTYEGGTAEQPLWVELTIGICPNCDHSFEYKQFYTHDPTGYELLEDLTEDEEDEEDE